MDAPTTERGIIIWQRENLPSSTAEDREEYRLRGLPCGQPMMAAHCTTLYARVQAMDAEIARLRAARAASKAEAELEAQDDQGLYVGEFGGTPRIAWLFDWSSDDN